MEIKVFQVQKEDSDIRIDKWFYRNIPEFPFSLLLKFLRKGLIRLNGKRVKNNIRIIEGQIIKVPVIKEKEVISNNIDDAVVDISKEDVKSISKSIVYENEDIIVLNKPYGWCIQKGEKVTKSIYDVLQFMGKNPKIIHRIDKHTTGVVVLAKNSSTASHMGAVFKNRSAEKKYLAVFLGVPEKKHGVIHSIIEKKDNLDTKSQEAITEYIVQDKTDLLSFVELKPKTGRKHQIRLHANELGCCVLGDDRFRLRDELGKSFRNQKMHLHAHELSFTLMEKKYSFKADLPEHMKNTINKYFKKVVY